jgi:virginiamycin B lyase
MCKKANRDHATHESTMSEQHHPSAIGERDNEAALIRPALPAAFHLHRSSPHRKLIFWLALLLVLASVFTVSALALGVATLGGQTIARPSAPSPATSSSVSVRPARIHLYKVSPPDAGLMLPAVDQQGNIWFGEMATNRIARLDPQTGTITTWIPPRGEEGIMGIAIDALGNVWFAEQNANYIGRFDPVRQTFRTFPFGSGKGQRVGLEDLQFDASGKLWFTEIVAAKIGQLDPASGSSQTWPLPASSSGTAYPFGLAITHDGQIWFGTYQGGVVGHLDPATGRILLYPLAHPAEQVYSMAAGAQGQIWFTELQFGKLGMIDTATGKITERPVPTTLGNPEDLHAVLVANRDIWFTSSGANALVRYSPDDDAFTFFQLPVPASIPFGLALTPTGALWFTAGGNPVNYVGEMATR